MVMDMGNRYMELKNGSKHTIVSILHTGETKQTNTHSKRAHSKANNDRKKKQRKRMPLQPTHKSAQLSIESQLKIEEMHDKTNMGIEKRYKTQ